MPIGKKVGSVKNLKKSMKSGGGGAGFIKYIPKDQSMTVRFLEEPTEWFNFTSHYDETMRRSYPCIGDNCPGCSAGIRGSSRYLTNALDTDRDEVVALELPKSLAGQLTSIFERKDTLVDRDFELVRDGEGLDTTYSAIPEAPTKRKFDKYTLKDLEQVLEEAYKSAFDDEDAEDVAPTPTKKSPPKKRRVEAFPDDDEPVRRPKKKLKK